MQQPVREVVIIGGGTAGWIAAALLTRLLGQVVAITLVESEELGTIGVGEATIPPILSLNRALGLDEGDFLRETGGTIKLGIEFEGWGRPGDSYMHAFGGIGKDFPLCSFHHFHTRYRQSHADSSLWDYSLNYQAAKQGKFAHLDRLGKTQLQGLAYAYHFDASRYAALLRRLSEARGVKRVEGLVEGASLDPESGAVRQVHMKGGASLAGDFFVDCSGFRGLLIEQQLHAGYEDWQHWLPCNRALAVQTQNTEAPLPYTRAIAHEAGWRWRIPLQHRVGNGLVYCDRHLSEEAAHERLAALLADEGAPITEPRALRFTTGCRRRPWVGNCVAVGLASGFLEPLESTSIHLIQTAVMRLARLFPRQGLGPSAADEYNRQTREEWEHVRDFLVMHYKLNAREGSFWRECAEMPIPDSLAHKIELFKGSGRAQNPQEALFKDIAWQQVLIGQGAAPADYHPLVDTLDDRQLEALMQDLRRLIASALAPLPSHQDWLAEACGGEPKQEETAHAKQA